MASSREAKPTPALPKLKTAAELTKGFADFSKEARGLRGIAHKARKYNKKITTDHAYTVYRERGGIPVTKEIFTGLEAKLKDVMEAKPPLSGMVQEDINAAIEELQQAANLIEELGGDAIKGYDYEEVTKESKRQFEASCERVEKLYKAAVAKLEAEEKDSKGEKNPAGVALKELNDDIKQLKHKAEEKLLEELKRIAKVEKENLFAMAYSPDRVDAAKEAHLKWKSAECPPEEKGGAAVMLKNAKKSGVRPGLYMRDNDPYASVGLGTSYGYGIYVSKNDKGEVYASITPPESSNLADRIWQAYLLINPSGKSLPLTLSCPGDPGRPATLENLTAVYNDRNGGSITSTRTIKNQVKDLLQLAKEQGVHFDAGGYIDFLRSRVTSKDSSFSFNLKDLDKLIKDIGAHNGAVAFREETEMKAMAGDADVDAHVKEEEKAKKENREEKKGYIEALKAPMDEKEYKEIFKRPMAGSEIKGDDAARHRVKKQIEDMNKVLEAFDGIRAEILAARDSKELAGVNAKLEDLMSEFPVQYHLQDVARWKEMNRESNIFAAEKSAISEVEKRLFTVPADLEKAKQQIQIRDHALAEAAAELKASASGSGGPGMRGQQGHS